ncbi:MAG: hypothetical protein ABJB11_07945 [Ferruginibacter sp.]
MQNVEFFHIDHFENNYHRVKPKAALSGFIDFFWQTKFDVLLKEYPEGFSDALFPNIGYTYLINLGTPFTMQVADKYFEMKSDGFLPRNNAIECYHQQGNCLFGIKFKIAPILFEKKINFAEYKGYIYPLSYLMEPGIIQQVKNAADFDERIKILSTYFESLLFKNSASLKPVKIVTAILDECFQKNEFAVSLEELAFRYSISTRTLHRYFETFTSLSCKQVLQIMRIRKATHHLSVDPQSFHYSQYGYYDHSHFYKHLKQFLHKDTLANVQPYLSLLASLHK